MIQRIQSLYLLLAAVAMGLMLFFPMAFFWSDVTYQLTMTGVHDISPEAAPLFNSAFNAPLLVLTVLLTLLPLITLMLYKNRRLQMKLITGTLLLVMAFIVLVFLYFIPQVENYLKVDADYRGCFAPYMPLVSMIMLWLSRRGVLKDEKLIRAADRLR